MHLTSDDLDQIIDDLVSRLQKAFPVMRSSDTPIGLFANRGGPKEAFFAYTVLSGEDIQLSLTWPIINRDGSHARYAFLFNEQSVDIFNHTDMRTKIFDVLNRFGVSGAAWIIDQLYRLCRHIREQFLEQHQFYLSQGENQAAEDQLLAILTTIKLQPD